jgi:hypothetical protein
MKTDPVEIFQTIRASLQPYTANGFTALINSDDTYELWSEKAVDIEGNKKDPVYFAGVKISENGVSFYLIPENHEVDFKEIIQPDLLNLLQEESRFYVEELDDNLMMQINDALTAGFTLFKQKGWV